MQVFSQPAQHPKTTQSTGSPEFFVDVWKLRQDVAALEPLRVSDNTDGCHFEGDGEDESADKDPSPQAVAEQENAVKREQDAARVCEETITQSYKKYMAARQAFNDIWLPKLTKAVASGDRVAEVILRQCATTPVLDRSNIESTCDENPQRRAVAGKRLKEIGFAPAFDYITEIDHVPRHKSHLHSIRSAVLAAFRQGAYGVDYRRADYGNSVDTESELADYRRWALIEAAHQDAKRMFTYRGSDADIASYPDLSLNRRPVQPTTLAWGRGMISSDGRTFERANYWRSWPVEAQFAGNRHYFGKPIRVFRERVLHLSGSGATLMTADNHKIDKNFESDLREILEANDRAIDGYLKDDTRWGIFLLQRIGHHEFVPQGMASDTHRVDAALIGDWKLERHFVDWEPVPVDAQGVAKVSRTGESTRISIRAKQANSDLREVDELPDITDCVLRKSGGRWPGRGYLPINEKKMRNGGDETIPAYSPFDSGGSYEQVLLQCKGAEGDDSDRVRFVLLAGNTLVEFSTASPQHQLLHIRHFKRQP
ncbi:hypothetical protein HZ993_12380 [Rhodoferax sp. AJA081-3]|uniref:hypothetical protein n=1 Tax=Rhodoferax sp. AJA081-3 TaxID=2752316 RepID=UPI001ADF3048|nr:hypothetical protein [Rhodoferax sp. AJA081-3]QTN26147.1 hypothetical protein HZ993_12380 [Rhodoferax sp. AJA081-3]